MNICKYEKTLKMLTSLTCLLLKQQTQGLSRMVFVLNSWNLSSIMPVDVKESVSTSFDICLLCN